MPRNPAPSESLETLELVPVDEIEELGDEAIIAQQSQAHLPQKRANVQEELPSVVIAEEPTPSSRRPRPYGAAPAETTVVVRDRRELEAMRRKIVAQKQQHDRARGVGPFVWAGLAILAFTAGGLVTLFIARGTAASQVLADAARPGREERVRPASEARSTPLQHEPPTPQVKLEELPLEQQPQR